MTQIQESQLFIYRAVTLHGKEIKGKIRTQSEAAAITAIKELGYTPLWVKDNESLGVNKDLDISFLKRGPKLQDLAVASKQLAVMISAGVPLLRSLEIIGEQTSSEVLSKGFFDVHRDVSQGMSMTAAMEKQPKVFPPLMINLVRVGESGGFLDKALESVAKNLESELKLRQKVNSAMAYPVVVLGVAVIAVIAMLVFVVPTFESLFAGLGSELPIPTQILVALSRSTIYWVPALVVLIAVGSFWYSRHKDDEKVRKVVDTAKLKVPVFGPLFQKIAIARFSRNLAVMLNAGVPMLQAIGLVSRVSNNWAIEQALIDAEHSVRHGRAFAQPLAQHSVFPSMVTQMVAVGEDSGSLDTMLESVAGFYDREVEATADKLTSLIEPLLIVFVGVVIGAMVVALYLPIFSMVTAVQGS